MENKSAKTVVITGASSGIGRAAALLFASRGSKVYNLSRHSANDENIRYIFADVTKPNTLDNAFKEITEEENKIDLLICCAGMGVSGPMEFIPEEDMKKQFEVNLYGTINTVKAVLPYMRKEKEGKIICISSVAAVYSIPFQAYYSASKAAINSFVEAVGNEIKPFGIEICALMPGDISTGFTAARQKTVAGEDVYTVAKSSVEKMEKDEINGMSPEDIAKLIFKLSSKKKLAPLYTAGLSYKTLVFLKRLFPNSLASKIIGILYCR